MCPLDLLAQPTTAWNETFQILNVKFIYTNLLSLHDRFMKSIFRHNNWHYRVEGFYRWIFRPGLHR